MHELKIIGHRGARGLEPENTVASLLKAIQHQVDEIEIDLRVTKDNVVVLHHNPYLMDPMGNKTIIAKSSYAELKARKPDLATFEEALTATNRAVPIYVEVKPRVPLEAIITIIKQYLTNGWVTTDFLLGSKSQRTLRALHIALPDIQNVVIEPWSGVYASFRARQVGTKRISMRSWWLWKGFLKAVHNSGYQITPYTMNDPAKVKAWQPYLYGIVTDYPDRFEK